MEENKIKDLVAKIAKEELGEDENNRRQSLEQFRDWILKNPNIKGCRTDDSFLLRFLRVKKFSVPSAEEILMNRIEAMNHYKELVNDFDINNPEINKLISDGYSFVSPVRDQHGRNVIIFNIDKLKPKLYHWTVMIKASILNLLCLEEDETSQVIGIVMVSDLNKMSAELLGYIPLSELTYYMKRFQNATPLRVKQIINVNMPALATAMTELTVRLLPSKSQRRFKICKTYEDLQKDIDPAALPKEMGGVVPMADMIDLWKKKLTEHRETILKVKDMHLVGDAYEKRKFDEIPGSFKTLQID